MMHHQSNPTTHQTTLGTNQTFLSTSPPKNKPQVKNFVPESLVKVAFTNANNLGGGAAGHRHTQSGHIPSKANLVKGFNVAHYQTINR